jgi:hypothetical protein
MDGFSILLPGTCLCLGMHPAGFQLSLRYGFADPNNHWTLKSLADWSRRTIRNRFYLNYLSAQTKYGASEYDYMVSLDVLP